MTPLLSHCLRHFEPREMSIRATMKLCLAATGILSTEHAAIQAHVLNATANRQPARRSVPALPFPKSQHHRTKKLKQMRQRQPLHIRPIINDG
jgi:hypothetical protein